MIIGCVFLRTASLNKSSPVSGLLESPSRSPRGFMVVTDRELYIYSERERGMVNGPCADPVDCKNADGVNGREWTRWNVAAPRPSIPGLTLIFVKYISVECAKGTVLKSNKCVPKTPSKFVQQQLWGNPKWTLSWILCLNPGFSFCWIKLILLSLPYLLKYPQFQKRAQKEANSIKTLRNVNQPDLNVPNQQSK